MMEDTRRLVRIPIGVDVGAVIEQKISHVEMAVDDAKASAVSRTCCTVGAPQWRSSCSRACGWYADNDVRGRPAPVHRTRRTIA